MSSTGFTTEKGRGFIQTEGQVGDRGLVSGDRHRKRTAAEKLLAMAGGNRVRFEAYRHLQKLIMDVAFMPEVKLTYSLVSNSGNGIVFRHDREYKMGFYTLSGEPWDCGLRGETFWTGILEIVTWYYRARKKGRRSAK